MAKKNKDEDGFRIAICVWLAIITLLQITTIVILNRTR